MTCSVAMKCPKLLVSIFLSICIPHLCHSQEQFAGPFRVMLRQIDQCDESGTLQVYINSTRISRVSRHEYVYSSNVTTAVYINDDVTGELDVAIFGNGGWRPHYMQLEFPKLCTTLKQTLPTYYEEITSIVHARCPIPPGTYEIKGVGTQSLRGGTNMPNFPYGKYRTDFSGRINGTLIGCVRLYADVVPAKRGRPKKIPKNNS